MAERLYQSPQGSRTGSEIPFRNEKRNDFVANPEPELSLSYSSSSSSLLDISRRYPIPPKKGIIRTFFTAPSERRRLRRRKSHRVLHLNNSSSSSVNTDLAYGTGFLKVKKRRHHSKRIRKDKERQKGDHTDAAILALGAGLAAVAAKKNIEDVKANRRTEVFNASGRRSRNSYDGRRGNDSQRSTRDYDQIVVEEEDWESASEAESELNSHVDSTLAFGGGYEPPRGKSTVVDPYLFGPANSLHGYVTEPVGFEYVDPSTVGVLSPSDLMPEHYEDRLYEERRFTERSYEEDRVDTRQPLQTVFPIPTSDPTRFGVTRGSVVSTEEDRMSTRQPLQTSFPTPTSDPTRFGVARSSVVSAEEDRVNTRQPMQTSFPIPTSDPTRFDVTRGSVVSAKEDRMSTRQPLQTSFPTPTSDPTRFDIIRGSVVSAEEDRVSTRQPMQTSFPTPQSDPTRFEVTRSSIVSAEEPLIMRPDPVPIQQPQPITPVSPMIYDQAAELNSPTDERPSSYGKSIAAAALAGMAGAAVGSMIATDRSKERKSGYGSDHEDRRKVKNRDGDRSERRSKRSDRDDTKSHRPSKRETRDGKADREPKRDGKKRGSPPSDRRDRRREKRRDPEREEDPEERRARRREQRRNEHSNDERYNAVVDAPVVRVSVDPFQFLVADDAFPTPDPSQVAEAPALGRARDPSPTVYTVEREPDFSALRSSPDRNQVYGSPEMNREPLYHKEDYHHEDMDRQDDQEPRDAEKSQRENSHSTDAAISAEFAARVAAAAAAGALRGPRSDKRRGERRGSHSYYEDKDIVQEFEDNQNRIIQEDADRAYRESVIARKAVSKVIRERSPSPDVVDKYRKSSQDETEEVRIVTPPAMEETKQPGPYDAPNADFELDRVMDPREFRVFSTPQIITNSPVIDSYQSPTTIDYEDSRFGAVSSRRPLLTLVRPTPSPSPVPMKQSVSHDTSSEKQQEPRSRSQSVDDFVIDDKGNVTPTSNAVSVFSKAVTWGPNETKHFEIESPGETRDEFIPSPPPEASKSVPKQSREKSSGWGVVAGAITGAAAGVFTSTSDTPFSPKSKPNTDGEHFEQHDFTVEQEAYHTDSRQSSPLSGSKPTGTSMPGSFADDIEFTATLAAGLQDSGFDPNIVIDDPTYRKRTSPPGSDEDLGSSYRKPFAETVSDLGLTSPVLSHEKRLPTEKYFDTETQVRSAAAENSDPFNESTPNFGENEEKSRDRDSTIYNVEIVEHSTKELPACDVIVREPESYIEPLQLSKKEQKKRDKAARRQDSGPIVLPTFTEEPSSTSSTTEVFAEVEDYFEPAKKSKSKKSKRNSMKYEDEAETVQQDIVSPKVSVRIDAFDDIINAHTGTTDVTDVWDTPTQKSKRKSKRDSVRLDSPSQGQRSIDIDVSLGEYEANQDPSAVPLPLSATSDPEPIDFPLPRSVISQISRDGSPDDRTPSKSSREFGDSGIFDPSSYRDSQSIVPSGVRYDEEESRRSKKKSRSSHTFDDDDTKSAASAPTYDEYESGKKAKKKSRSSSRYDDNDTRSTVSAPSYNLNDDTKKSKKGGFFGLFGISSNKSDPGKKLDESSIPIVDEFEEPKKKKKKSKRSSLADSAELYGPDTEFSRTSGNGHRKKDDNNDDSHSSRRRRRSMDENKKSSRDDKDSFLAKAGTLGAGVGLAGAAMTYAVHHLHSEATNTNTDGADISLVTSSPPIQRKLEDSEISHRPFRPSIDPQYGDLLPLPPSDPPSPEMGPHLDNLPQLPDSRPETPELDRRMSRERNTHFVRKPENQPLKSPSQSAIPLRFMLANRSTPASPDGTRSFVVGQTAGAIPDAVITPRARARPTSWDSTKEFKPLYLVQHSRHGSSGGLTAAEDQSSTLKSNPSVTDGQDSSIAYTEVVGDIATITSANIQTGMSLNNFSANEEPFPVEATSKNRSSYLLQDTPPSKKHTSRLASVENSPTPMERDEQFEVSSARDKAFNALSGSQANDPKILGSPVVSNAPIEALHFSTDRTVDTNAEAASIPQTSQEVVSSDPTSTILPGQNISVLDAVAEDTVITTKDGIEDERSDLSTASIVNTAAQENSIETQPSAASEESAQFSTARSKKGKKKKESTQVWESEYPSTSNPTSTVQWPEPVAEFSTVKSKKTKKRSKELAVAQDYENSTSELITTPSDLTDNLSNEEVSQSMNRDGAYSAGIPVAAISAAQIAKRGTDGLNHENQLASANVFSNSAIQTEQGHWGLAAGYKEDQLALAKQLQEEFGSGSSKKSKKGKKKAQSSTPTTDVSTPLDEEQASYFERGQNRGRELENSQPAEDPKPTQSLNTRYNNEQLELARQLQAEFGSGNKKSKKEKKKSRSTSRPVVDDSMSQEFGEQSLPGPLSVDPFVSETLPKADFFEAGYTDDQLQIAQELQASSSASSKKTKGKKRQNIPQIPNQDLGSGTPHVDEFHQAMEVKEVELDRVAAEPDSINPPSGDGLASGYNEEQLLLAKQLKEEFGNKSKLSKKEKKRQSLLRSSTFDDSTLSSADETSQNSGLSTPYAETPGVVERAITADPDDGFTSSEKSQKGKKKRGSQLQNEVALNYASDVSPNQELADLPAVSERNKDTPADAGDTSTEPGEFSFMSKKSKKERKKRQSQLEPNTTLGSTKELLPTPELDDVTDPTIVEPDSESTKAEKDVNEHQGQPLLELLPKSDDGPAINLANSPAKPFSAEKEVITDTVAAEPWEEPAFTSKKSKKDKKKRQSEIQAGLIGGESSDVIPEPLAMPAEETNIDQFEAPSPSAETNLSADKFVEQPVDTALVDPVEEFSYSTKKSKKDKKKRKSQIQSPSDVEIVPESEKPLVQDFESLSHDAPAHDSSLQESQGDPNLEIVPVPEEVALNSESNQDVVSSDNIVQPVEDKFNANQAIVQALESTPRLGSSTQGELVIDTQQTTQPQLDSEEGQDSISKTTEADNGDDDTRLVSQKSKKDNKGKSKAQKDSEENDISPGLKTATDAPDELVEPTMPSVPLISKSTETPIESAVNTEATVLDNFTPTKDAEVDVNVVAISVHDESPPISLTEFANKVDLSPHDENLEPELAAISSTNLDLVNFHEPEASSQPDADPRTLETSLEPVLQLTTEPADQLTQDTSRSLETDEATVVGSTPQEPNPEDEFVFTAKKSKKDRKKKKGVESSDFVSPSTSTEPLDALVQNNDISDVICVVEPLKDDLFSTPGKKSKKDKKKKRASVMFDLDSETATGSSTPAEQLIESNDIEDVALSQPVGEPVVVDQVLFEPAEENHGSSTGKSQKDKKDRASIVANSQADDNPISLISVETKIESSTYGTVEDIEPAFGSIEKYKENTEDSIALKPDESSTIDASIEPVVEFRDLATIAELSQAFDDQPISESLKDDFIPPSTRKSKKDKKKQRASATWDVHESPNATGASTPIEPQVEFESREYSQNKPAMESSNSLVEIAVEATNLEQAQDQPYSERSNQSISVAEPATKPSNTEVMRSPPIEELSNDEFSNVAEPSKLDILPNQSIEQLTKDEDTIPMKPTKLDNILSQITEEPTTTDSSIPAKASKFDSSLIPTVKDSSHTDLLASLEPTHDLDISGNITDQPGAETAIESMPSSGKKLKKDKKKRKGGLNQQSDGDTTGTSTPAEKEQPGHNVDAQSFVTIEQTKDEFVAPTEPLNAQDASSQPIAEPAEDEFVSSTTNKSKREEEIRKIDLDQLEDTNFIESLTPAELVADLTSVEQLMPRETSEPVADPTPEMQLDAREAEPSADFNTQEQLGSGNFEEQTTDHLQLDLMRDHPAMETAALEDDSNFSTSKKSKKDKKKRKSVLGLQDEAESASVSISVEPAVGPALPEETLPGQPGADTVAPEEDDFAEFTTSKKSRKEKKKRKSALDQQESNDNTGTSIPAEPTVEPSVQGEITEQKTETMVPQDDYFDFNTSKKSKKDKKKKKATFDLPDDAVALGSLAAAAHILEPEPEIAATPSAFQAEMEDTVDDKWGSLRNKKSKKDKKNRKGTLDLPEAAESSPLTDSSGPVVEDAEQSKEIFVNTKDPEAVDPKEELGLFASKKSKKNKKMKKAFDLSEDPDTTGIQLPTGDTDSDLDQINVDNTKSTLADQSTRSTERDVDQPISGELSQLSQPMEDNWDFPSGKKFKKNKKKHKTVEFSDELNVPDVSTYLFEQQAEGDKISIEEPLNRSVEKDATAPSPTIQHPPDFEVVLATSTSQPVDSSLQQEKGYISTLPDDLKECAMEANPSVQDPGDASEFAVTENSIQDKVVIEPDQPDPLTRDIGDTSGFAITENFSQDEVAVGPDRPDPLVQDLSNASEFAITENSSQDEVVVEPDQPDPLVRDLGNASGFAVSESPSQDKVVEPDQPDRPDPLVQDPGNASELAITGNSSQDKVVVESDKPDPLVQDPGNASRFVVTENSSQIKVVEPDPLVQDPGDTSGFAITTEKSSKDKNKEESLIASESLEGLDVLGSTEHSLQETSVITNPIPTEVPVDTLAIHSERILQDHPVQDKVADSVGIISNVLVPQADNHTEYSAKQENGASALAENQELGKHSNTFALSTETGEQPTTEEGKEDSVNFVKMSKKDKKKRKSILLAGLNNLSNPTPEPETTLTWADGTAESKELQVSSIGSGNSDLSKESPGASSDFGSLPRKSSKKSKKRGKSEVDLAAIEAASDELAASSHEPSKLSTSDFPPEDTGAPPLKRGHYGLFSDHEPELATPDAEGVNPLLSVKRHKNTPSRTAEPIIDSTKQLKEQSGNLASAVILGASAGIVASLAAKFEAPKADTKKSKKGKKKSIDNRSINHDDLFDDPILWEGAERTALSEPTFTTEAIADDDFWIVPAEALEDEIPMPDIKASRPVPSDGNDLTMTEDKLTSREGTDVDDSTPRLSKTSTKGLSSALGNEDNFLRETKSEEEQSTVVRVEPLANLEDASDLRIPKTRSRTTNSQKEISKSPSSPPTSTPDVYPVTKEFSRQIPSVHPRNQPLALDPNRDSTLVDESPIPPQRGFDHDYIRDSGVQLREWSTSPAERKPEAVSDNALKRLSWPRVDDDTETIDLARPRESSIKAELDKHIDDIARDVAVATGVAAARHRTPSPRSVSLLERSLSPRSLGTVPRRHTPEQSRALSAASNRSFASNISSATPPLRRSDRRRSGDLRSLSQRSEASSVKESEAELRDNTENNKSILPGGQVLVKGMADVYDGFGEGRLGSPISPTRPPSMRRRQSKKVLDLEAQVHQLAEENRMLSEGKSQAEQSLLAAQRAATTLADRDAEIDSLKRTIDWLHREVSRLTEVNEGLSSANITMGTQHDQRYNILEAQHNQTTKELHEWREMHANASTGMEGVQHELENTLEEKNREIAQLYAELEAAKEQIRKLQREILATKANDFLTVRDEDYFDNACRQLCGYVQQWVLRFSKFSDMRACRLTSEVSNEKIVNRLDNAVLDGSDVDKYLSDRVKRRDIFMSMTMMMVWEFVFTRYLFGMDREQRQKLKSLEKILAEVGPQAAVHQWRAVTLTLLAKRDAFLKQREQDTEAVVQEIFSTLSEILPPPSQLEDQIQEQLRKVMKVAVDLSIEMRTQKAEYMMLPPLQPEYDANGDLAHKFPFNAGLMNERSGDATSNEELEEQGAVVRVVLFPLVVKKGDDRGEGDDEIVICPAQVLVAKEHKRRRSTSGRNVSGGSGHGGVMGGHNGSRMSVQSTLPGPGVLSRDGSPF